MAGQLPTRYIVIETVVGMTVNAAAATLPALLSAATPPTQSLQAAATGLAPQVMAAAIMSAAAPSLLTGWRQSRGRFGGRPADVRPTVLRTAVTALVLSALFTGGTLSFVHSVLPIVVGESVGGLAMVLLGGAEGVLAAALLTPLALLSLYGRADR